MPMLIQNQNGTFVAFVIGNDNSLMKRTCDSTGTWGEWESEGGWHRQIAVAAHQDRRIEVFTLGSKNELWSYRQKTANGQAWEWLSHGDPWWGQISVAPLKDGRLRIFALGSANELWTLTQKSPNGDWEDNWIARGGWWGQIAIAPNGDGSLQVVALGSKNELWSYKLKTNGDWDDTPKQPGGWWSQIAIAPNGDGRLQLFVLGSDKSLWSYTQKTPNGEWEDAPLAFGGVWRSFVAVTQPNRTIAVYALAADTGDTWALRQSAPNVGFDKWQHVEITVKEKDLKSLAKLAKAKDSVSALPGPVSAGLKFRERDLPILAKSTAKTRPSSTRVLSISKFSSTKSTQEQDKGELISIWVDCAQSTGTALGAASAAVAMGAIGNAPGAMIALVGLWAQSTFAGLKCNYAVEKQLEYNKKWGQDPGVREVMRGVDTVPGPWDRTT
jgi:hypothetical protein